MKYFILLCLLVGCDHSKDQPPTVSGNVVAVDRPEIGLLTLAVLAADGARVDRLIEMGSDINENVGTAADALTPLLAAIATANAALAISLVIRGASPVIRFQGYSALDFALGLGMETLAWALENRSRP
ncbi:MAG: hypothetical protein HYR96_05400 [Deltaproteobacteria bacterium]|nr:hypothetical protein [Deltaproteobacteria bacterium]MBI3295597.1 hypothetical protein [Deltaproteobacteria bacterium]